jgi:phosphate:Na+ symporter
MTGQALGGLGLFLIGMVLTTDGLRAAAGDALRRLLLRFTGGPFKALLTGAAVTAIVQSSSAITMATIGFVGAGLITFHQSLGLIFGANLGTTATGWIVAGLGLKFSMSAVALPMVGVGALVRLFTRGRGQHLGLALAGFGMIFVGIDVMQAGMERISTRITPELLPDDSWLGRLALLGMGMLLTAITQSSSAAMATTLTALHAGSLSLPQAAAMVIGVNVGTTVTAVIAAIGTSLAAKRTALAHLLFNTVTGLIAFLALPAFVWLVSRVGDQIEPGDSTVSLAAFHTAFNLAGVAVLLPFSRPFAELVERLVKERGPRLTRHLDPRAAGMGVLAVEAVRRTANEIAGVVFVALRDLLRARGPSRAATERLTAASEALRETQRYMTQLQVMEQLGEAEQQRHLSTIHALDHIDRLVDIALAAGAKGIALSPQAEILARELDEGLSLLLEWAEQPRLPAPADALSHLHDRVVERRTRLRTELLGRVALGKLDPADAEAQLESLRWLDEVAHSLSRLAEHLRGERVQEPAPSAPSAPF